MKYDDLTGKKFLNLTVVERFFGDKKDCAYWKCLCVCGKTKICRSGDLKKLGINSCGCKKRKLGKIKHGLHGTKEYRIWQNIKRRCYSKKSRQYKDYGGRGIFMCKSWKKSFFNFYKDMGKCPKEHLTLDRINNNKGYSKSNCRWETRSVQALNTRRTVYLTMGGVKKPLYDWARELNLHAASLYSRKRLGWTDEKILTTKGVKSHADRARQI